MRKPEARGYARSQSLDFVSKELKKDRGKVRGGGGRRQRCRMVVVKKRVNSRPKLSRFILIGGDSLTKMVATRSSDHSRDNFGL